MSTRTLLSALTALFCFGAAALSQSLPIRLDNVPAKQALIELQKQSGYALVYAPEDLDTARPVNVDATSVEEALRQILAGQQVSWTIRGKVITIRRSSSPDSKETDSGKDGINGIIVSKDGFPVVGAVVKVSGSNEYTITDVDGNFSLDAIPGTVLEISCLGYLDKQEKSTSGVMSITLQDDVEMLSEAVMIGYGSVKKSNLTGAVSSIKMEDVEKTASPSVTGLLRGRVAGRQITQTSAQPDASYQIVIRGQASTGAGNTPLYVIDGFPGGSIDAVNPNDIESIEVLKDASSTSIYGARAANGVILVTTKKGKEGKPVVSLRLNSSLQTMQNSYDIMNAAEYMTTANRYYYEKWLYDNKIAPYGTTDPMSVSSSPVYPFTDEDMTSVTNTDYWNLMTRAGFVNEENLSISGGTDRTHYMLSLGHYGQDGIIKNSGNEKYMLRVNMDYSFNKFLTTGITVSGTRSDIDVLETSSNGDNPNIINSILMYPNYLPPYNEDGSYSSNPNHVGNNPLSLMEVTNRKRISRFLVNNYWLIQFTPELQGRVSWGLNYAETRADQYWPKTTQTGSEYNSKAEISQTTGNDYLLDATLTYSKTFGGIHALKLMAGYAYQKYTTENITAGNSDFITDSFNVYNLDAGGNLTKVVGSSRSISKYVSFFGRINYDLKDRYLFTFTVRADGSDKFGRNNRYGIFPSGAFAWRISEEPFMQSARAISNLKLRLSLGQTGNAEIGGNAYGYYATGSDAVIGGNLVSGVSEAQLSNPNLKWETTTEFNVGLDFGFFNGRISGSVEYYRKVITDLLDYRNVGSYYPVSTVADNLGSTQSSGAELQLSTVNIQKGDFTWTSDLTVSHYQDRWRSRNPYTILSVYQTNTDPLHITWGYRTDGLIQEGETVPWDPDATPGSIKVVDLNGWLKDEAGDYILDDRGEKQLSGKPDGAIDDADMTIICDSAPDVTIGLNNTITWKNWDLSFFLYASLGAQRYNYTKQQFLKPDRLNYLDNISTDWRNIWTSTNPSGIYPNGFYTKWENMSDFWVEDADYLRLKRLTIGYTLPRKTLGMSFCRIFLDAQNLFCITNYSGIDPEVDSFAAYPNAKTFSIGIDINF